MKITGKTTLAGIIGWPVTHTLSPLLHGYWLEKYKIDGAMVPLPAKPDDFAAVVDGVRRAGFRGLNVTVPHKEAAFALADYYGDYASQVSGAVNLLIFHDNGKIEGRNTDAFGFIASLTESLEENALEGKRVVLLGAGGAARAIALALNYPMKAAKIHILNRTEERAEKLAESLASYNGGEMKAEYIPGTFADWPGIIGDTALLINATTAGMTGGPPLTISLASLPDTAVVCDIVYTPLETKLLENAKERNLRTIDGLGMLMYQAGPSFEAFFGTKPQITSELRDVLTEELRARQ